MPLSEMLVTERRAAGLTQEGLAAASGVSLFTIRSYETGRNKPSAEALAALCEALGISCEKFTAVLLAGREQPAKARRKGK